GRPRLLFQRGERLGPLGRRDLLALVRSDPGQNVSHGIRFPHAVQRGAVHRRCGIAPGSEVVRSRVCGATLRCASHCTAPGKPAPSSYHALDTWISRSRRPPASPEASDFWASATPSFRVLARPATTSPAAALNTATSRNGPFCPLSTVSNAAALASASPPRSVSGLALPRPTSSGPISNALISPFSRVATVVGPQVVI